MPATTRVGKLSTLDPRMPLVLDTHELGRRPGAMQRIRRSVPGPADLGIGGVGGLPEATDIDLTLLFDPEHDLERGQREEPDPRIRVGEPVHGDEAVRGWGAAAESNEGRTLAVLAAWSEKVDGRGPAGGRSGET